MDPIGPQGTQVDVEWLLHELCVDLGFCLPPAEQARMRDVPLGDVDGFTDAVFAAEGLDPRLYRDLRQQVRERVARYFGREPEL